MTKNTDTTGTVEHRLACPHCGGTDFCDVTGGEQTIGTVDRVPKSTTHPDGLRFTWAADIDLVDVEDGFYCEACDRPAEVGTLVPEHEVEVDRVHRAFALNADDEAIEAGDLCPCGTPDDADGWHACPTGTWDELDDAQLNFEVDVQCAEIIGRARVLSLLGGVLPEAELRARCLDLADEVDRYLALVDERGRRWDEAEAARS